MKFKVGDIVECIDDSSSITVGASYQIYGMDRSYIQIRDDLGKVGGYFTYRFKLSIAHYRIEKLNSIGI